jgi:adenosylhomocysteine nucleosidase
VSGVAARADGREAAAGPLLVVAAMRLELAPRLRRSARCDVVAAWTGEGAPRAAQALGALLERLRPRAVVGVGAAAGLAPALAPGQLVVAREVRDAAGSLSPDRTLLARALAAPGTIAGTVIDVPRLLVTAADKREAWIRAGRPAAAVADLESAAWARTATAAGIPWLVLRSVSDAAGEELPLDLESCRAADGRIRRPRVVGRLLRHPGAARGLFRLRARIVRDAERVAGLLEALVRDGER